MVVVGGTVVVVVVVLVVVVDDVVVGCGVTEIFFVTELLDEFESLSADEDILAVTVTGLVSPLQVNA